MKIGILTFYACDNYGAVLQSYCLASYIKSLGHDVKFIHHELSSQASIPVRNEISKMVKNVIVSAICDSTRRKRSENFKVFANSHFDVESYSNTFDKIIIGSDQVWNLNLTNNDKYYLGNEFKCQVYSYAASCGDVLAFSQAQLEELTWHLKLFGRIAVREQTTKELLQSLLSHPVELTVDPTLLVDNDVLVDIQAPKGFNGKYVLVYDCMNKAIYEFASNIARQLDAKVIALSCCVRAITYCKSFQSASVGLFLKLFSEAKCVVTTSFHGCAMSLSYNRNFYAINFNCQTTSRMRELLESLGLQDRFVNINDRIQKNIPIDFFKVNSKLELMRKSSREYINEILED